MKEKMVACLFAALTILLSSSLAAAAAEAAAPGATVDYTKAIIIGFSILAAGFAMALMQQDRCAEARVQVEQLARLGAQLGRERLMAVAALDQELGAALHGANCRRRWRAATNR